MPLRPRLATLLARVAHAIAPDLRGPETLLARVRLHVGLALLDASDRLRGLPPWVEVARAYTTPSDDAPPSTLRSAEAPPTNSRGGAA